MIKVKINKILSIAFLFLIIVFSACREEELFDQSTVSTGNITTLSFSGNPMDLLKVTTRASDIKDENEIIRHLRIRTLPVKPLCMPLRT